MTNRLALLCLLFVGRVTWAAPPATAEPPAATKTPDDINRHFLDPDLDPEKWLARFEVESREVFAARKSILTALDLKPGDRIADIGSGTGLYLAPFSTRVGVAGRVYAVDISPRLIEFIEDRIQNERLGNVAVVLSAADSTRLAPGSVSHAFACDAYHHFEQYKAMLASILAALVPGGEFVVVDFDRIPGVSRDWLLEHVRADKATVRGEIEAAGFEFIEEVEVPEFEENYLLRFRKPLNAHPATGS